MARHGWSYDASFSINIDNMHTSLNFKKNRKPCGISLTNVHGGDFISVTIAGGGMDWNKLRGARATTDPAVASFSSPSGTGQSESNPATSALENAKSAITAKIGAATAPKVSAPKGAAPKAKAAPQATKRPATATPKRSR
jgi:hypothetical protein